MKIGYILISILPLISFSCNRTKEYHYDEESIPFIEEKYVVPTVKVFNLNNLLYANDDYTAKKAAHSRFESNLKKVLNENDAIITGKANVGYLKHIPSGYTLTDKNGRVVDRYISLPPVKTGATYDSVENNNVFAGLEFGMSLNEAKSINLFKNFRLDSNDGSLNGSCEIGLNKYNVNLLFYKGALYQIQFTTFPNNSFYSSPNDMTQEIVNLLRVLRNAYGIPSTIWSIPSDANYDPKERFIVGFKANIYTWDMPNKNISIGYERRERRKFRMVATIADKQIINKIRSDEIDESNKQRQANDALIEQSSQLFN